MQSKINLGLLFVLVIFSASGAFAFDLKDLVGYERAAALIAGEKPVLAQFRNPEPNLIPANNTVKDFFEAARSELGPSVMVETLHLYAKPEGANKNVWSANEEARLYNEVLALSTLAGLEYFSASRGSLRTFYETSSVIDGPATKKPLPDPTYPRPQSELTIYVRQKDLTFGDNIYQYNFYSTPGALIFIQQNLTSLNAGIIPAVGKNKLRSIVAVLDAGDYLLIYAASMAKVISLPGINERVGNSFANRAEAILHWFSDQADKAFVKGK